MQDVPGPVDDGLEQLVPRPGGRGEARHLVQEAELFELIVGGARGHRPPSTRAPDDRSDGRHWSIRRSALASPYKPRERLRPERLRRGGALVPERSLRSGRVRRGAGVARVGGGRRGAARDRLGRRARPARPRGPAARRVARPGHRRAGRPGAVRDRRTHPTPDDRPPTRRRSRPNARASTTSCGRSTSRGAEAVIEAFGLYFGLVNLAEARGRVRTLRRRERASRDGVLADSLADAVAGLRRLGRSDAELDALVARLVVAPVFTAHPTEARRRTTLVALGRCAVLLARLDDPRLTPSDDREVRRRLREEITILWRTSDLRVVAPTPLDEVRTAMAFFDATLFTVIPRLYRALDAALDGPGGRAAAPASDTGRTGTRPPRVGAFLRPGSWIGGDRDGNPGVTAEITERTVRIHADHVLRGYEAVATRLMQTVAAATPADRVRAAAGVPPRARRGGPARDRPTAPPPLPGRAVPAAVRVHRRATASDAGRPGRRGRATDRAVRVAGRARDRAGRDRRRARRRRPGAGRVRRGGRAPLAGRDVRVPPRVARGPPARGGPPGGAGRDPRRLARHHRAVARRHAGRGARHVPGDRRDPGALRRRVLPPLRHQLHRRRRRT